MHESNAARESLGHLAFRLELDGVNRQCEDSATLDGWGSTRFAGALAKTGGLLIAVALAFFFATDGGSNWRWYPAIAGVYGGALLLVSALVLVAYITIHRRTTEEDPRAVSLAYIAVVLVSIALQAVVGD